ncbi:MAG: hypothetical protein P4M12_03790 [Gammaproteobacteria bacterium]|nr:hypothetical protein [Gammaproteobacteria bacterium]
MKSKFFSIFVVASFVTFCMIATSARAEFYTDYLPQDNCGQCYSARPHCSHSCYAKKHKYKQHRHYRHSCHRYVNPCNRGYHRPSSYHISVTYVCSSAYRVNCCNQGCGSNNCCEYRRTYEPGYNQWHYEPDLDMSTQDDVYDTY